MPETPDLIESYLRELRAGAEAGDTEVLFRRLDTERKARTMLDFLAEEYDLRVLPDRRLGTEVAADFLVQIEEYELRLVIEDVVDGRPQLSAAQFDVYHQLLHLNPATVGILIIWTGPDLPALVLRLGQLRFLQQCPERLAEELEQVRPLEVTLRAFMEGQTKEWALEELEPAVGPTGLLSDTRTLFEHTLRQYLAREAGRRYRREEKVAAAQELSERDVASMLKILDAALAGERATELAARLVRPVEGRRP